MLPQPARVNIFQCTQKQHLTGGSITFGVITNGACATVSPEPRITTLVFEAPVSSTNGVAVPHRLHTRCCITSLQVQAQEESTRSVASLCMSEQECRQRLKWSVDAHPS